MFNKIIGIADGRFYWLFLLLLAVSLEVSALFYQYYLDYMPCVLCIHVRIWVLGLISISAIALIFHRFKIYNYWLSQQALFISSIILSAGLLERSYQLLGTERGFLSGGCSMESGLPNWFALDKWLPVIFEVQEPCGYTPELLWGITMAEALILLSIALLLINTLLSLALLINQIKKLKTQPI